MDEGRSEDLDWVNVGIGFAFIAFNVVLSALLGLDKDIPGSLVVAAVRCIAQLSLLTVILQPVFRGGPWAVAGIAVLFNVLGTVEAGGFRASISHCAFVSMEQE
ncbi:hypothetical protein FRB99_007704 [Tulasnella sp. 403]|nr:hypothetical protein FRB99_007704 [Tulasnella sp. 403]